MTTAGPREKAGRLFSVYRLRTGGVGSPSWMNYLYVIVKGSVPGWQNGKITHCADVSGFVFDDLATAPEEEIREVLGISGYNPSETTWKGRVKDAYANRNEALVAAVVRAQIPVTGEAGWQTVSIAYGKKPDVELKLVGNQFGVKVWELALPVELQPG